MEFNVLGIIDYCIKRKKLYFNYGLINDTTYQSAKVLYLDKMTKKTIEDSIFHIFAKTKKPNKEILQIAYNYNQLVDLECVALDGIFIRKDTDNQVMSAYNTFCEAYKKILGEIKKYEYYDNLIVDGKTGIKLSDSFKVENLEKITVEVKKIIDSYNKIEKKESEFNPFVFWKKYLDNYYQCDREINFLADDRFGKNAVNELTKAVNNEEDFDILLKELEDEAYILEEIQDLFKDYKNCNLCYDKGVIPFQKLTSETREALVMAVYDNVIISLDEAAKMGNKKKISNSNKYLTFEDAIKEMPDNQSSEKETNKTTEIKDYTNKVNYQGIGFKTGDKISSPQEVIVRVNEHFKNIVGLNEVKQQIIDMINYCNKLKTINKFSMKNSHMCFVGNPGTGKTTVARIVAETLYEEGYLSNNVVKEVGAVELRGEYMGQTGPKVQKLIKASEGGILFLDEAYQLMDSSRNDDSFGKEALAILIKEMEDNPKFMTILAGYEEQTNKMIKANQGLDSRIGTKILFKNYTIDELLNIADNIAKEHTYIISDDAKILLKTQLEKALKDKDFANGRFIRNFINKCERIQTRRAELSDFTIVPEDVEKVLAQEKENKSVKQKQPIGFSLS